MSLEDEGGLAVINRFQHQKWFINSTNILFLLFNFFEIYDTFTKSVYYYYFSGKTIGNAFTSTYFILNYYADWDTIEHKPQWERFSDEPIEYKVT